MEIKLTNNVSFITGGTRRIGRKITEVFARAGIQVAVCTGSYIEISGGKFCVQNPDAAWAS